MTVFASNKQVQWPKDVEEGLGITSLEANLYKARDKPEISQWSFVVAAEKSSVAASSKTVCGRYLGNDSSSDGHCAAISEWINECRSHEKCSAPAHGAAAASIDNPLTTRCLRITKKGVRLEETKGTRGSYLILSHRWGTSTNSCSTTTENYNARLRGNGFGNLTPNFLDAIEMARKLNYSYIWIDSLCTIQSGDNERDWRAEALNMADYYQNASFTLFALCTQATDEPNPKGMLFTRTSPIKFLARLNFFNFDGEKDGHIYLYKREWSTLPSRNFKSAVLQNPMLRRG